jgi:heat shock protein HtpX
MLSDVALRMFIWGGDSDNRNSGPLVIILGVIIVVLAPIMAAMIQMAISRQREYLADATGAMTTRDPEGLASALEKLETAGRPMKRQSTSTAHLFFSNPLKPGTLATLFSTHPPLQDRIDRLRSNAGKF